MSTYDELGRMAAFPADQVVQAALMIRTGTVVSLADHPRSGTTALHPFTSAVSKRGKDGQRSRSRSARRTLVRIRALARLGSSTTKAGTLASAYCS